MNPPGTIFPVHQVGYEGSTVTISCKSTKEPKWSKDGIPFTTFVTVFGNLVLTDIKDRDSGNYTCHGFLNKKSSSHFTVTSTLLVAGMYNNWLQ